MASTFEDDIFSGFDVAEDEKSFLASVILSPSTPANERNFIFHASLLSGYEDWNMLLECAGSIQHKETGRPDLDCRDLLAFVGLVTGPKSATLARSNDWVGTDNLIRDLVESLQENISTPPDHAQRLRRSDVARTQQHKLQKPALKTTTSPYWGGEPSDRGAQLSPLARDAHATRDEKKKSKKVRFSDFPTDDDSSRALKVFCPWTTASNPWAAIQYDINVNGEAQDDLIRLILPRASSLWTPAFPIASSLLPAASGNIREEITRKSRVSPYFTEAKPKQSPKPERSPSGTISTVPFPPLSAPVFGLIQEQVAHDPFWLLIVVTFLIKTNGNLAIPTFYQVKARFPSAAHLADPEATRPLTNMIRHLGLSVVRTAAIQRYARGWVEKPPRAGVTFRVRNYDKRDILPAIPREDIDTEPNPLATNPSISDTGDGDAWEIGHLTQGKYAIDSWRIFCRDELLNRAQDWNGKGASPEFQPEWMRVRPDDKELRACLRWMWMREGWEWDPRTGERTVLRHEMQIAVNEKRVEYDTTGGLRILDTPRAD